MAASDYFDLPDTGEMLESQFREQGWSYKRIDSNGVKDYKQVNFGPNLDPGSPTFGKDMIFEETKYYPNKQQKMSKQDEFKLPDDISEVDKNKPPLDLVIVSIPKMGKGTILGQFTKEFNGLVFDLEKGGYEYIEAKKISIYSSAETSRWEAYQNYIQYRKVLLEQKGKYKYLIIDGLTDLDDLSEIGGTLAYMDTVQGKSFNRVRGAKDGEKLKFDDPAWKSVLTLGEGYGYQHTRAWFLQQIEFFRQISPYRIYAAHVTDKMIKDNGKEEVVGSEIALTGKLKTIFAAKVTSLAKLIADGEKRYLNFDVANDSIIAGSRAPHLTGKILISTKEKDGKIVTFWENIYKK